MKQWTIFSASSGKQIFDRPPLHLFALLLPRAGCVFRDRSLVLEVFIGIFKKLFESLGIRESLVWQNILQRVVMSVSEVENHHFLAIHDGYSIHYILLYTSCAPPPRQNSTICRPW